MILLLRWLLMISSLVWTIGFIASLSTLNPGAQAEQRPPLPYSQDDRSSHPPIQLVVEKGFALDPETAPLEKLIAAAPDLHPAAFYSIASRLFKEGRKNEAGAWLYFAQLRYRTYLAANPDLPKSGDPALSASLQEVVGRPINEYLGGNVDEWIAAIDKALDWDRTIPNHFTSLEKNKALARQTRQGLVEMRNMIDTQRDEIKAKRKANGLPNR